MARDIPLGNGNMLVTFDTSYLLRDCYFPMVGHENHTAGHLFRAGIYLDGEFSWIHDGSWSLRMGYEDDTLATAVTLSHQAWRLTIEASDVVDVEENIMLRHFRFRNATERSRDLRMFLTHDFHIYGVDVGDTAFYDPMTRAIVHYKGQRYFLVNGQHGEQVGAHQWATGRKETAGMEGTWRDAEDGVLEAHPITQGSVDSTIGFQVALPPASQEELYVWICAGTSLEDVRRLNALVGYESARALMDRTRSFWRLWAATDERSAGDTTADPYDIPYRRGLLTLRTNIDNRGGILAANDSDIMHHSRDTYSYVWPRDGAWVARALDQAGYRDLSARFFTFCGEILEPGGYFLHKYNPDRSLASSWHPWWLDGRPELPIQEDETGIVLWALWQHFVRWRDVEMVQPMLRRLVFEAGQFMIDYQHPELKLPWPSWDLWEERRGIHTYTVATVFAGLTAAGHFSRAFGETQRAQEFYQAARQLQEAGWRFLVDKTSGVFLRRITVSVDEPGEFERDPVPDASLLLLPQLGFVHPSHPAMVKTARWVRESLWVPTKVGGLARYAGDYYHKMDDNPNIPGNPWFISTLWYADYLMMTAQSPADLAEVATLLDWVSRHALESGVLAEQLDPYTGAPMSVSPLTWSHAALVLSIVRYRAARTRIEGRQAEERPGSIFRSIGF
ncbi:MAG: glycoside hydrolase family 15 protein [Thermaerobacter sp.]|nr:glycoside hydrolase family 15 protein [Thermaerobacter sp.]